MARSFRSSGRGARLRKTWLGFTIDNVSLTTTQASMGSVALGTAILADATVLRVRGEIMIIGTPDAATDSDVVGLGLVVVRSEAATAGGTSLPGPIGQVSSDSWLWHQFVPLDAMGATTEALARTGGTAFHRVTVDSKAMRKLPQGSDLILVGETLTGEFVSVLALGGIRVLLGS